jgi:hypothetical protein
VRFSLRILSTKSIRTSSLNKNTILLPQQLQGEGTPIFEDENRFFIVICTLEVLQFANNRN